MAADPCLYCGAWLWDGTGAQVKTTLLIAGPLTPSGVAGGGTSPAISGNGWFVTFDSQAADLAPDIFDNAS